MKDDKIIEKLRDDEQYYGKFGKKYISNSDIKDLIYDPAQYGAIKKDNENFVKGRFFHQLILEPNKAKDFPIVDIKGRNTKAYKTFLEENNLTSALTLDESKDINDMVDYLLGKDKVLTDLITGFDAKYEEPAIGRIFGRDFKAKADIINQGIVIDLKSTSDIHKFKRSANIYGYDSQAFIYQTLFGMPMTFVAVGKIRKYFGKTNIPYFDIGVYPTSEEFIIQGQQKVELAMRNYELYFGPDATKKVEDLIINSPL